MWSNASKLRDLLLLTKDGEWGKGEPEQGHTEALVIRGTDFAAVRRDDIESVPIRYIDNTLLERKRLCVGDILIETAGGTKGQPTGRTVIIREALLQRAQRAVTCASFARFLRADPTKVLPEYLYWWLQEMYRSGQMDQHQVQHTGIARFQYTRFADSVLVPLPPRAAQERIAEILDAMEQRIAVLRRMNKTLESIAEALFRSWFVDFDPVRSKAEGHQPQGMTAETAALFPNRLVETPHGKLPASWTWLPLDRVAQFLNGLALQKFPAGDGESLPVIKIAQLRRGSTDDADRASNGIPPEYVVHDGDILFSWSGSLLVSMWAGGRGALNQHLFKVTSTAYPKWFCLFWCKEHLPEFQRIAQAKATTMGHIQRHHLTQALVVVPSPELIEEASRFFEPLLARGLASTLEARTLIELRDTLLPKLLSGQVRFKDAEAQLAASI